VETCPDYSFKGIAKRLSRNKQYPPRHAHILFPPTGGMIGTHERFVTAYPSTFEIGDFLNEDNAKTLSLCLQQELDSTRLLFAAKLLIKNNLDNNDIYFFYFIIYKI
jgi:hypothetical protein